MPLYLLVIVYNDWILERERVILIELTKDKTTSKKIGGKNATTNTANPMYTMWMSDSLWCPNRYEHDGSIF